MRKIFESKSILLGVTGSVAAYKSIELIRRLRDEGASVRVIMTQASTHFVTPLSLNLASGEDSCSDMFATPLSHVALPRSADVFLTAPATANIIAKYANGIADDLLSTAMMAFKGPAIIAPAMNWRMWENPVLQKNLDSLISLGVKIVRPDRGSLACGEEGIGKMASTEKIIESVKTSLTDQDLAGERILITAGPTREYLDPVRFISNRSSGKMGYALAKMAKRRGADVILISGPVSLELPDDIIVSRIESATEMYHAVMDNISKASLLIMSAAVADFTPSEKSDSKIEKKDNVSISLLKTIDILGEIGKLMERPFTVGFAAETGPLLERARKKLLSKNCDMIIFNNVTLEGAGFDVDTNEVAIVSKTHDEKLPLMSKEEVARTIFDRIIELRNK
ncbi:MAG: bifunctional phosphopantothenoylcysteine decarboxylase/phosphopantothenate--cysteine ligase CoaBC [Dissulfurispiraceae bacterium]